MGVVRLVLVLAGCYALALALACSAPSEHDPEEAGLTVRLHDPRGAMELFQRQCAVCHGPRGEGDGRASPHLAPPPRDLRSGRFRVISGLEGRPTRGDLERTIAQGMPGSAMPGFSWLGERAVEDLAELVLWFAEDEGTLPEGFPPPVDLPPLLEPEGADAELGSALFAERCASCHGSNGQGDGQPLLLNEDGTLNRPRDFTRGILRGGGRVEDLARRILLGMPGTSMPAQVGLEGEDLAHLVAYTRGLIPEARREPVWNTREQVFVRRVEVLPDRFSDPLWSEADTVSLPLAPLVWREDAAVEITLSALHDGERIAFRMSWDDATRDDPLLGGGVTSDALAVMFSAGETPPLFSMGSVRDPVSIWHWRAVWPWDAAGALDTVPDLDVPHFGSETVPRADVPVDYRMGGVFPDRGEPERTERLLARGPGRIAAWEEDRSQRALRAGWTGTGWWIRIDRPLAADGEGEVALMTEAPSFFSIAVWDGDAGDARGRKSVTFWHALEFAP